MSSFSVYNPKARYKGDTSNAIQFTLKDKLTGDPIDFTGASIKSQFRKGSETGKIQLEITNGNGITIVDAVNGIIRIDQIDDLNWAIGSYYYDIETTFLSGYIRTYIKGVMCVIQDTTNG